MSGDPVVFSVHGVPAPQGSKTRTRWGMREDNPATGPWRNAVAASAFAAMSGRPQLAGPLELDATFVFRRPKSHYGTGRNAKTLKPSAPVYCPTVPDLDKLLRAVGDALTGVVFVSDAVIVEVRARKHYGAPAAHLVVRELGA